MTNWLTVPLLTRAMLLPAFAACSGVLSAQDLQRTMQQYVASQAVAEFALRGSSEPGLVPGEDVRLEKAGGLVDGLELWRAILPSDHSHPYILAVVGGEVIRLGGFTAPELSSVAPQVIHGGIDARTIRSLSEQLALLADPNGAIQWVYAEKADQPGYISVVTSAWRKHRPRDWPRDTIIATKPGWLACLTLLSRDTRSYTLHWVPLAFSFEFSRDGQLVAWAQRRGGIFGVPGVPLPPRMQGAGVGHVGVP